MDIFQGESEYIVDNEYLGTPQGRPPPLAGRKIDFSLNEECLLTVVVDRPEGPKQVELATRDTPEALKEALEEDELRRKAEEEARGGDQERRGGLFSSFRRFWGGNSR